MIVEVYIFDYHGDLYGQPIEVQFLEYVRGEKKFQTEEALKKAIHDDVERVKRTLKKYLTKGAEFL